ncbi:MAG: response regulator transcription factor [Armatimonadota bacterium]|nr:response regulator transcription factor [Armatimonadota bacterium]MDR7426473.1 response regulator transcription factor [Armatimonadota bacterium]MDR7463370.1 response regulator transcription factor [Armatimonadota bacterium]MDR7468575.1 response regulator transcription factor [Armatimonadota bacterium]MDR7475168.1 response regulator transcription factor [Armatimonadota bacterium]
MRVLLADDHPLFRDGVRSLLQARGVEVVGEAGDGEEAVEAALRLRPDVILMDISMPRMNGLEATRVIKARLPQVKIVMLTVSDEDRTLFEAVKSGAQGYLLKNLQADEFFDLLSGLERGEAPISRSLAGRILEEFARRRGGRPQEEAEELTEREREVLRAVSGGASNREVAAALHISENTVKFHMKNILDKLHLRNRAEVVAYAARRGWLPPETTSGGEGRESG